MPKVIKSEKVPAAMQPVYDKIVELTNAFCEEHLTEEYAQLIRYATAALCRKRPSPFARGKIENWACGITYALGSVNFLFDRSQKPSMSAAALCDFFRINPSTGAAKSKIVRDMLGMYQLHPHWTLTSLLESNPMAWIIMYRGLEVDVRYLPRAIQVVAHDKGLIPYVPADKV